MLKAFIRMRREQNTESIVEVNDVTGRVYHSSSQSQPEKVPLNGASIAQTALNDVTLTRERAHNGELALLDTVITWENVLCLMRNIVCHEDDQEWSSFSTLAQYAIQFFGTRAAVADLLSSYYRLVVAASKYHFICTDTQIFIKQPI